MKSPIRLYLTIILKIEKKHFDKAVVYDGNASRNYYHHFVNAVNSMYLLHKSNNLSTNIPLIVNRKIFRSPFFNYLYSNSEKFRAYNWVIQEPNEWFYVKTVYKLQCLHFDKSPWLFTRNLYTIKSVEPFRKVFLSRDKNHFQRCLQNE